MTVTVFLALIIFLAICLTTAFTVISLKWTIEEASGWLEKTGGTLLFVICLLWTLYNSYGLILLLTR